MGELSAGSPACLRQLPLFLCSPSASLHQQTPTDISIQATALVSRPRAGGSMDPSMDDFVAQSSLEGSDGNEGREGMGTLEED